MKRKLRFILLLLLGISFVSPAVVSASPAEEEYQVNAPNWTDEQFLDYYIENEILVSSPPSGTEDMLYAYEVGNHLQKRFSDYTSWSKSSVGSNSVATKFGGEPVETDESDPLIQQAKNNSTISGQNYIGCGPLALVTQLDFLARYAGYTQFATFPDSLYHKVELAKNIFDTIQTYPAEGPWGQLLKNLGINIDQGTFTFPHDFISGTKKLFMDYNINTGIGVEDVNPDGSYRQHMLITGDTIPSLASHSAKINKLKSSIDKGMPVVWWTTKDAGDFGGHFMNIFAYETWVGTNSSGQKKEHLMFKLRFNWGISDVYMDSDLLDAVNGGFIFFEEQTERIFITPEDYGFPQQYHYYSITKELNIDGYSVTTKRLRTGYINETGLTGLGDWHLTMSSKRQGAGMAYIEYYLEKPINYVYFDVRLWSSSEGIYEYNATAAFEYKNSSGEWVTAVNFFESRQYMNGFSYIKDCPDKYRVDFPYGITAFRFISTADNPTNTSTNKGRIVIGTVGIVFDTNDPNDSELFVTIFSDNDGKSSSFNFSGHAWVEIYNNSPNPVLIGKYWLPAFEGVTVGTYGNKTHNGLYYNLEYHYYLTVSESSSSGSSGSSSSSSGSSGSFIVIYASGRVSITEVFDVSVANTLTSVINANDEWALWDNCTHFAIDLWNSVSETDFSKPLFATPTGLINQIKEKDNYQINRNIFGNNSRVGYYSGNDFIYSTS